VEIQVEGLPGKRNIGTDWVKDQHGANAYRKAVKAAMLIGSVDVALFDAADPQVTKYSPADVAQLHQRKEQLMVGRERINSVAGQKKTLETVKRKEQRTRDKLIKFSKKCCLASCNRRERWFTIDNGELLIYRGPLEHAALKAHYRLMDSTMFIETRRSVQYPAWETGYDIRLRVDAKERQDYNKGPLYLYAAEEQKVHRWKRAFQMARVLTSENDRRALKVSIGRAASGALIKGWDCLVQYYKEMASTKALVKQMAMRLMKVEVARGYTKLRMVYKSHCEREAFRREQQIWAARFMSERLGKISLQKAKSGRQVRESVISRIQARFRRFRDEAIFDRKYPLRADVMSKASQLKLGLPVDFAIRSTKGEDALTLCLTGEALNTVKKMPDVVRMKKATYSEVNLPVNPALVYVSDNLTSLSFSNNVGATQDDTYDMNLLTKAAWSKFVNLDRIGSVVLHSEPDRGAQFQGDLASGRDEGVWLTINGPRLAWGKRVVQDSRGGYQVAGATDGLEVPERLAKNLQVKWAQFKVSVARACLATPALKKTDFHSFKCYAVTHVLGYAAKSEISAVQ
jgi:hypothetical protein